MRHWRKNDEVLTFDSMDEEEASSRASRRYAAPRSFSTFGSSDEDDEDDVEYEDDPGPSHEALEPLVRAGKYKPKPSDPWTIHILYQALRDIE